MFQWLHQYHNAIFCYERLLWGRREKPPLSLSQTDFLICLSRHLFLSKREKMCLQWNWPLSPKPTSCSHGSLFPSAVPQPFLRQELQEKGSSLFSYCPSSGFAGGCPTAPPLPCWAMHPCSVGSGKCIADDLLYLLVSKHLRPTLRYFRQEGSQIAWREASRIPSEWVHSTWWSSSAFFLCCCSHTSSLCDRICKKGRGTGSSQIPASFLLPACHLAWSKIFITLHIRFWKHQEDSSDTYVYK